MGLFLVFTPLIKVAYDEYFVDPFGQKHPTGAALKLLHLVQKNGIDIVAGT